MQSSSWSSGVKILEEIHKNFQTIPLEHLSLPTDEPLLEDFDITKESLKEDDFESVKQKLKILACADWRLFMKLLISQGYDLWLTKAFLPTRVPKFIGERIMHFC